MESVRRIQGRDLGESDIEAIRSLIAANPAWHRTRLSVELTRAWNWRSASGRFQDMAARSLLLKLERRGAITLPSRRGTHHPRRASTLQASLPAAAPIAEPLAGLLPLHVGLVPPRHPDRPIFSGYLSQHHYLGYRGPVGESLAYLVRDCQGRDVACVLFGAAAWKTKPRDAWIGWDDDTRTRRLSFVANNHRFLILPWVQVPHLASHILGRVARRLAEDWQTAYGHPVHLLETFVERERFKGTCYRAANWTCVGQTQGRSRQDRARELRVPIKDVYLYPLASPWRERLCHVEA
ncbi:MAG: DUF4338 domain-containing protein [Elusimicrobia bacterium]|nr:DUF4338 domain-containing protein [Elusimicrobiota bacterium]